MFVIANQPNLAETNITLQLLPVTVTEAAQGRTGMAPSHKNQSSQIGLSFRIFKYIIIQRINRHSKIVIREANSGISRTVAAIQINLAGVNLSAEYKCNN